MAFLVLESVSYKAGVLRIEDADLLLWRNGGIVSWAIRLWTHAQYSHVAMAYWHAETLAVSSVTTVTYCNTVRVVDTVEGAGGRDDVPLARLVRESPGLIDVYGIDTARFPEYNRAGAVRWARANLPGRPYGRRTFLHVLLTRLPLLRVFRRPDFDDLSALSGHHVCSSGRCAADRIGGGVDPVQGLADAFVTPGHLANSLLYVPKFTLGPDDGQEEER